MVRRPDDDSRTRIGFEPDDWVPISEAAARTGSDEAWLVDRCRDGRLPSRSAPGSESLVPLTTAQALVAGRISE